MKYISVLALIILSGCAGMPSMTDSCTTAFMEQFGECVEEAVVVEEAPVVEEAKAEESVAETTVEETPAEETKEENAEGDEQKGA